MNEASVLQRGGPGDCVGSGEVWTDGEGGRTWHSERQIDTRGPDKVCGYGFYGRSQPLVQDESSLRIYSQHKMSSPRPSAYLTSWHCLYFALPFGSSQGKLAADLAALLD